MRVSRVLVECGSFFLINLVFSKLIVTLSFAHYRYRFRYNVEKERTHVRQ